MERWKMAEGLRAIADLLEEHTELPEPSGVSFRASIDMAQLNFWSVNTLEEAEPIIRLCDRSEKENGASYISITGSFRNGKFVFGMLLPHERVCTKKVIGTKHVEKKVIPEQVIEEHDEEITEWVCPDSFLRKEEAVKGSIQKGG